MNKDNVNFRVYYDPKVRSPLSELNFDFDYPQINEPHLCSCGCFSVYISEIEEKKTIYCACCGKVVEGTTSAKKITEYWNKLNKDERSRKASAVRKIIDNLHQNKS